MEIWEGKGRLAAKKIGSKSLQKVPKPSKIGGWKYRTFNAEHRRNEPGGATSPFSLFLLSSIFFFIDGDFIEKHLQRKTYGKYFGGSGWAGRKSD
jgi:hypothetical protein